MNMIPNTESLESHIKQAGITFGPKKLDLLRKACTLRGVPSFRNDGTSETIARVKLFDPCGSWTWFISEWDGSDICFGLVDGFEKEYGDFSLVELSSIAGPLRIGIEVDVHWLPQTLSSLHNNPVI